MTPEDTATQAPAPAPASYQPTPEEIDLAIELLVAMFSPMDLLFYGLAVYEGYRLSLRRLTVEDVRRALGHAQPAPTAG